MPTRELPSFGEAVEKGLLDVMEIHIENGIDVNVESPVGRTYLHDAARTGNLDVVELLINSNTRVNVKDRNNFELMYLIELYQTDINIGEMFVGFNSVLNHAGVHSEMSHGWTPLHEATINKHAMVVDALISAGSDVNAHGFCGWTPLHCASESNSSEIVEMLLNAGANVNTDLKFGWSALHSAAGVGNLDIVKLLVEAGSDLNALDFLGKTPLTVAYRLNRQKVAEYLNCCQLAKCNMENVLKKDNSDIEAKDSEGRTDLIRTVWEGLLDSAKEKIREGADINARCYQGRTVLHDMVDFGRIAEINFLLSAGANINAKDNKGKTPLHLAVTLDYLHRAGEGEVSKILIANGADINSTDNNQWTPLHLASHTGNRESVELLVSSGADLNAETRNGATPNRLAERKKHFKIAEFLSQKSESK